MLFLGYMVKFKIDYELLILNGNSERYFSEYFPTISVFLNENGV